MAQYVYKGFSTQNAERTRNWALYDIDLVKQDLINHFMTRKGERVMRPDFGSIVWDALMEPMTAQLRQEIINDAVRICKSDVRIKLQDVRLYDLDNGIRIEIIAEFVGFNIVDTFSVFFERNERDALGYSE
jgi:Phage baseplate assembly protein W